MVEQLFSTDSKRMAKKIFLILSLVGLMVICFEEFLIPILQLPHLVLLVKFDLNLDLIMALWSSLTLMRTT